MVTTISNIHVFVINMFQRGSERDFKAANISISNISSERSLYLTTSQQCADQATPESFKTCLQICVYPYNLYGDQALLSR